jgi:hypothetical protein
MPSKLLLTVFISTFLNLTSIDAQVDESPIPPEFKCPDCILVIVKPENEKEIPKFEKNVVKQFDKYYSGKYVLATLKELDTNSLYQDIKTYRFRLDYKTRSETRVSGGTDIRGRQVLKESDKMYISFFLYDRESETAYRGLGEGRTGLESLELTAKALDKSYK